MLVMNCEINFTEASIEWMRNKIKLPNGEYRYVCGKMTKKNKKCKNPPNCKIHKQNQLIENKKGVN